MSVRLGPEKVTGDWLAENCCNSWENGERRYFAFNGNKGRRLTFCCGDTTEVTLSGYHGKLCLEKKHIEHVEDLWVVLRSIGHDVMRGPVVMDGVREHINGAGVKLMKHEDRWVIASHIGTTVTAKVDLDDLLHWLRENRPDLLECEDEE